jgi:phospholipid/cholesterol/gamma-HCH transport system substrate-binding protein
VKRICTAALLASGLALSGCSYQTANSPQGGMAVEADFTDIQNLAIGDSAKINNVGIGTITGIHLVGSGASYQVRVDMSLKKGIKLPVGTTAQLSITSLLGENFVALVPPGGLNAPPYLPNHSVISNTTVVPAFEQVVGRAGPLLQALSSNDISTIVQAGSTALNGRGPELQKMIGQITSLTGLFASQRANLDDAVTQLANLGHQLAAGQSDLDQLPGNLAKATQVLADDKDDLLTTISKITTLAQNTDNDVLLGNVDHIRDMVQQLGPVIGTLAANKTNLAAFIGNMQSFVTKVPQGIYNGQLLLYPVLTLSGFPGVGNFTIPTSATTTKTAASVMNTLNLMTGGRSQ